MIVKLSTTDGDMWVPADEVACLIDPEPATSDPGATIMMRLKSGGTYEVSGDLQTVAGKLGWPV